MEFKYLVIKCEELHDQYECDAYREPVCLTNDISNYGLGYEVYEIKSDGSFECIKGYDYALEEGMAIYFWGPNDEPEDRDCKPTIIKNYKNMKRSEVTKSMVKKLKKEIGFTNTVDEIFLNIKSAGHYGEEIDGNWIVFGEYMDSWFSIGY